MKRIRFDLNAEAEMVAAAQYYESQQPDLGKRFIACIQESTARVALKPGMYPVVDTGIRRCLTKTFPFGIIFRERENEIQVLAVMHLHRDPDYWKNR